VAKGLGIGHGGSAYPYPVKATQPACRLEWERRAELPTAQLNTQTCHNPPEEHRALADFLGCHEEERHEVWEIWRQALVGEGDALYWLDVEFIAPCPEG